jgi:hypothetical protein
MDFAVADVSCHTEANTVAGAFDNAQGTPVVQAWKEPPSEDAAPVRCTVTVERRAPLVLPTTVRVTFEDGTVVDEAWDGQDTWKRFSYLRAGKAGRVREARIDPRRTHLLDASPINDARSRRLTPHPTTALAGFFLYLTQLCSALLAVVL